MDEKDNGFEIDLEDLPDNLSDEIWSLLFPYLDDKKAGEYGSLSVSEKEDREGSRRHLRYLTM